MDTDLVIIKVQKYDCASPFDLVWGKNHSVDLRMKLLATIKSFSPLSLVAISLTFWVLNESLMKLISDAF